MLRVEKLAATCSLTVIKSLFWNSEIVLGGVIPVAGFLHRKAGYGYIKGGVTKYLHSGTAGMGTHPPGGWVG